MTIDQSLARRSTVAGGGDFIVPSPSSGGGDDTNTTPIEGDTFMLGGGVSHTSTCEAEKPLWGGGI